MNSSLIFSLFYLLFELKYFTKGLDVRKDSWYRDVDEKNAFSDDIRCFCNLPQCISTGYMCRTARSGNNSGCFSEISKTQEPVVATRHGCIELLNISHQRHRCDKNPTKLKLKLAQNKYEHDTEFVLLCCHEDMCNHIDNPENQKMKLDIAEDIDLSSNSGKYQSIHHQHQQQQLLQHQEQHHHQHQHQQQQQQTPDMEQNQKMISTMIFSSPGRSNNDDWFRVATIAVPICGAVILFSLIAIAMKILRTDRSTSISLKLENSSSLSGSGGGGGGVGHITTTTTTPSSPTTTTTTATTKDLNRKFLILDHEAQITSKNHHNLNQQSSNLLEQYSINCNNSNSNNNNNFNSNNSNISHDNYCDKKNETRAKINQLFNIQYSLLPQQAISSTLDDHNLLHSSSSSSGSSSAYHNHHFNEDKFLSNNCICLSSLFNNSSKLFYKNVNNNNNNNNNHNNSNSNSLGTSSSSSSSSSLTASHNNMMIDKHNKIYVKDILSPICENWIDDHEQIDKNST